MGVEIFHARSDKRRWEVGGGVGGGVVTLRGRVILERWSPESTPWDRDQKRVGD